MGLESATYIGDLVQANPDGANDPKSQGDNHIRLIKTTLQNTFPGMIGRVDRWQPKSGSYTGVVNDNLTLIEASGALTLNLTAAATLGNGWTVMVYARAGDITVDPNASEQVNGVTSVVVATGYAGFLSCDGTKFLLLVAPITQLLDIPKSLIDAKGDLIVGTANDTPARKAVGGDGTHLMPSSGATDGFAYVFPPYGQVFNLSMTFSTSSGALTANVKTQDGGDASNDDPIYAAIRKGPISDSGYSLRKLTAALSLVISSGSTLGHTNGVLAFIYWYLIDNGGVLELAASTKYFGKQGIVTTSAEGGAGGADSATTMYSATARTSVPFILIGKSEESQTTAGTWVNTPSSFWLEPLAEQFDAVANVGAGGGQLFRDTTGQEVRTHNFRTLTTALSGPASQFVTSLAGADVSGDTVRVLYTMGTVPSAPTGPSGPGGSSLHPDSLIEMADGRFEWLCDIRIGDEVKGMNGERAKVLGIWRNVLNERPMWFVNGVAATAGHLFKTREGWACCSAEEYRKRHGDHYILKTSRGYVDIYCGIVHPDEVRDLAVGDHVLVAGGKYVEVESIVRFETQGEENQLPAAQEVISLYLDNAKAYYCDGYAVSTIA